MRNKFLVFSLTATTSLVGLSIAVSAQTVYTQPSKNSGVVLPEDPNKDTALAQRTSDRLAQFKKETDAYTTQRITSKCQASQAKLKVVSKKDNAALSKLQESYVKLANRLGETSDKLKELKIDISGLEQPQKTLTGYINEFLADTANYKSAVDDALAVNCANDPTGFVSNLLDARAFRAQLAGDIANIKSATPDVKSAFVLFKTRLSKGN